MEVSACDLHLTLGELTETPSRLHERGQIVLDGGTDGVVGVDVKDFRQPIIRLVQSGSARAIVAVVEPSVTFEIGVRMPPSFTITVNKKPVPMTEHRVTGLEVKQAAVAAGVDIELDFQLSIRRPNGHLEVVDDNETVTINKHSEFRAVAPDDNS